MYNYKITINVSKRCKHRFTTYRQKYSLCLVTINIGFSVSNEQMY